MAPRLKISLNAFFELFAPETIVVKTIFSTMLMAMALVATHLLPQPTVMAQTAAEPAIVISMASIDDQLDDVLYLTEAAGFGQMGNMARMQAEGFLRGVDKKKAIGVMLYFQEGNPEPQALVYVPVTNIDDMLDTISGFAAVEDVDNYSVIRPDNGPEMFVMEMGGYAVLSPSKDMFDGAPEDISGYVGEMPKNYNMAAKLFAQRIPAEMRQQGIAMIESSYRDQLENMSDGTDIAAELQMKNFEMQMQQIKSLINETDQLVVGLDFDKANKNIHMDIQMVGLDGSILAKQSRNYQSETPSRFSGFLADGATFTANANAIMSEDEIAQYQTMMTDFRKMAMEQIEEEGDMSDEELGLLKGLMDEVFALLDSTVAAGKMDMGANVMLDDENANIAMGMAVANPAGLENKIKDLVAKMESEIGDAVTINLDCENVNGIRFHEVIVPVPGSEEELQNLMGESAKIYIGFGSDVIYVAAGSDPMENLKSSMKASSSDERIPMQYNLFLAPLLKKIAAIQGEDMVGQMAEKLANNGRDRIRFTANAIPNGLDMRFEVEDGLLELIGMAAAQFGGAGPGVDF